MAPNWDSGTGPGVTAVYQSTLQGSSTTLSQRWDFKLAWQEYPWWKHEYMKGKYISNTVSSKDTKHQYTGVFDYVVYCNAMH